MDQLDIVHLESYRGRREARYEKTLSLHARDRVKAGIVGHLWRVAALIGADRCAVVWLDDYGPGLAHPHVLLDLVSDRPRRSFSPVPLKTVWDTSVPGLLDLPRLGSPPGGPGSGIASSCVVSIGSDGPRSWFLVADSLTPRQVLSQAVAGDLMFLAGEISSLVLHRDLRLHRHGSGSKPGASKAGESAPSEGRFAGWPVLKDLDGLDPKDPVVLGIRTRFLVARVVRGLVEDELSVPSDVVDRQVDRLRRELDGTGGEAPERGVWERVLHASAAMDWEELTSAVLEWGGMVGDSGHVHGAQEILRLAFELARLSGLSLPALDAARFLGKILRAGAQWDEALGWYGVAEGIADDLQDTGRKALVLDGLANTFRDRGNLPKARETLHEVLEIARSTGDRYAQAIGHHDLMTVEKVSGDLLSAIQHGWQAVQSYDSNEGSLRALFDLSGVLRESGEVRAARDGYSVVADQVAGFEYRILALDALALLAAKEGDLPGYRSARNRMDEHRWRELPPVYLGQVLFFRGMANRALGLEAEERKWFEEALAYAEGHGLNKLIFDIEEALSEISDRAKAPAPPREEPEPFGKSISGVRSGLKSLRRAAFS